MNFAVAETLETIGRDECIVYEFLEYHKIEEYRCDELGALWRHCLSKRFSCCSCLDSAHIYAEVMDC